MIAGITENLQTLSGNGLTDTEIQVITTLIDDCKAIENQREILKGKLHEQTLKLELKVDELKVILRKYGLIIKAVMPRKSWIGFGISAKR